MTPGDDQIPWVRNAFATGNENQVDRLVYDGIPGKLDERPVGYERCVERGESVLLELGDRPKVLLDGGLAGFYSVCQTVNAYCAAAILEGREALIENAVDEDQAMPLGLPEAEPLEIRGLHSKSAGRMERRQTECVLRDRRHTREMPILILGGGVPERLEAGDCLRPQIVEPRWTGLLPLKILAIGFDRAGRAGAGHSAAPLPGFSRHYVPSDRNLPHDFLCGDVAHEAPAPTPAEFCTQSYPCSSSSSASSLPPDLTILPFASTCTKSGMM